MDQRENGEAANHPNGVRRITLTLTPETGHLHIDMDCPALDEALAILERARLMIDARFRFNMGRDLFVQAQQDAALAGVARDVINNKVKLV
jgi:hypothetical protein